MLCWRLERTKSQIVLEGKEAVLIFSLFKLFIMMLVEELFGKVMNVCVGGTSFIRGWIGISLRVVLIVDFKGFRFSKAYKRFGI